MDEEAVAFCVDCLSTIPDHMAYKDPFLAAGKPGLCPFCKGAVTVTYPSQIEHLREKRKDGKNLL